MAGLESEDIMLTKLDHIDIKVPNLDATVKLLSLMGLEILRKAPPPRSSVEMVLNGENHVVIELHPAKEGGFVGVHHIAFQTDGSDLDRLKAAGISFSTENKLITATGRTVSSFQDENGLTWQLTD